VEGCKEKERQGKCGDYLQASQPLLTWSAVLRTSASTASQWPNPENKTQVSITCKRKLASYKQNRGATGIN